VHKDCGVATIGVGHVRCGAMHHFE